MSLVRVSVLLFVLAAFSSVAQARKKDPEFATGPDDPVLRARIASLAPGIDPAEARRIAEIAYTTGRDLKKEWNVVWPPGLQNFLVNTGQRKGGLCFQFAERLLWRLSAFNWNTVEFHWAESFERTASEHNVIVVTAKGQNFYKGIILDNWRYGGRLVWGPLIDDPHYQWHENKSQFAMELNKRPKPVPSPGATPAPSSESITSETR
jgi:hypothetical protein